MSSPLPLRRATPVSLTAALLVALVTLVGSGSDASAAEPAPEPAPEPGVLVQTARPGPVAPRASVSKMAPYHRRGGSFRGDIFMLAVGGLGVFGTGLGSVVVALDGDEDDTAQIGLGIGLGVSAALFGTGLLVTVLNDASAREGKPPVTHHGHYVPKAASPWRGEF